MRRWWIPGSRGLMGDEIAQWMTLPEGVVQRDRILRRCFAGSSRQRDHARQANQRKASALSLRGYRACQGGSSLIWIHTKQEYSKIFLKRDRVWEREKERRRRERERERERKERRRESDRDTGVERGRERERGGDRESVWVWVCVCVRERKGRVSVCVLERERGRERERVRGKGLDGERVRRKGARWREANN